jgi:hypothetical protein
VITGDDFTRVRQLLGGVADADIEWAENIEPPATAEEFAREVIFVIANSGMKNTVAREIYERCIQALDAGQPVFSVFKHKGKAAAIEDVWARRAFWFDFGQANSFKPDAMEMLPWIGGITKFHVAKNFGAQVAKPDVHLQRLAEREGTTAQALCERLADETGYRVATVDTVLWRACANGVLDSRTGAIAA